MWWMVIIPIGLLAALYYYCPHKMAWWEYTLPVGATLLSILFVNGVCDYAMSRDEEFHGGWVVEAVWNEHWTELYTTTETYTVNGKTHTRTVTKTRYHPDDYDVTDSNGYNIDVDSTHFEQLANKFNNRRTEHPFRSGKISFGDGRRFTTVWPRNDATFTPCFTSHSYENRVARSHSVFNFKDVSEADRNKYNVQEYPEIYDYHYQESLLGWADPVASKMLTEANARLGAIKEVRMFVIVFPNQPLEAGVLQQHYWKNGNKNEIVVCVGTKLGKIDWVYPFGWDNQRLLVDLREDIAEQKNFDPKKVVATTIKLVHKNFKLKDFHDFDYIKLEPPLWAVFLSFLFVGLVNGGVAYYVVNNEHEHCAW